MKTGIVAFAFGAPAKIRSNASISLIVARKAAELKAPVFTQQDVQIIRSGIEVIYVKEKPGDPPPTLRIARIAVRWAREQGIRELWIIAAGPHVWRCERDLKYAVSEVNALIKVRVCKEIKQNREIDPWYCRDSSQSRTRSFFNWWSREAILRLMPMFLYKRIAG